MNETSPAVPRAVAVAKLPIELAQFLKFSGLTESGGAAKQAIGEGRVLLNGVVETRKGRKLGVGDQVAFSGQTLIVQSPR